MSKPNNSEIPNIPHGPATGAPTPPLKNEVLGGKEARYDDDRNPGTGAHTPGHRAGGPGHADCDHS